jgi:hypothetical protein
MSSTQIEDLATLPIQAKAEWISKTVTVEPPKYLPHTEYALQFALTAEVPVLATIILREANSLEYHRFWRSAASTHLVVRLAFFPYDWKHSDQVQINLTQHLPSQSGGVRVSAENGLLKHDPRQLVSAHSPGDFYFQTGAIQDLAAINLPIPLFAQILVLVLGDTESIRGRWRLKESAIAKLPSHHSFLKQGRSTGTSAAR